ncbi:MAG TPA: branched-chain amino acid ABC transporter permease [Anaerolineaceae bacterium]|nr:MAG: Azaleucine resistance protein AzlC [Anaerolineaceae bacterium 46_22]HAF48591.1 branched-chain amino acid ABC transporter permease [Anaerolineaceae bacterium]
MNNKFFSGMKASIPACLGVIPVGISFGLLAVKAGLTNFEATLMSAMVMAGAAQLMSISMIAQGAALSAIILGTFFINLRHIVMSSSVMHRMRKAALPQRLAAAFALCDESFAIYSLSEEDSYLFLLGINSALYGSFIASTVIGSLMTDFLPQIVIDSFSIALYAAFLGLLLPSIKHNLQLILLVVGTALLNWLMQFFLPPSWSLILAMVLGAAIGVFVVEDEIPLVDEEGLV